MSGAVVQDVPRVPAAGSTEHKVFVQRSRPSDVDVPELAALEVMDDAELRARIVAQISPAPRGTPLAERLVNALMERRRVFGPMVTDECTQTVEFEQIGSPTPVSFRVTPSRKAHGDAAQEGLLKWIEAGVCERVPWTEPSYGNVIFSSHSLTGVGSRSTWLRRNGG